MPQSSNRSTSSSPLKTNPSPEDVLAILGPDIVPAWEDLSNVGKLRSVCWDLFEELKYIFSMPLEDQDSYQIHGSCLAGGGEGLDKSLGVCLWSENRGPSIRALRNRSHWGCHFCTL